MGIEKCGDGAISDLVNVQSEQMAWTLEVAKWVQNQVQ